MVNKAVKTDILLKILIYVNGILNRLYSQTVSHTKCFLHHLTFATLQKHWRTHRKIMNLHLIHMLESWLIVHIILYSYLQTWIFNKSLICRHETQSTLPGAFHFGGHRPLNKWSMKHPVISLISDFLFLAAKEQL